MIGIPWPVILLREPRKMARASALRFILYRYRDNALGANIRFNVPDSGTYALYTFGVDCITRRRLITSRCASLHFSYGYTVSYKISVGGAVRAPVADRAITIYVT